MEKRFARHEYVTEGMGKEQLYSELTEPVRRWLEGAISSLNRLQLISVPLVLEHRSTLILAPTGSGKTLASFLGLIDRLVAMSIEGRLEDRIYAVYVSPLRALNNDIHKNLQLPLEGVREFLPEGATPVRSAVRTGDTTTYEKSKMLRRPPHILITTPESLGIVLASQKFSEHLKGVEWLLVDEIHALASDKRGVFLSLMMEWLETRTDRPPTRIGLSATISPIDGIANFLMGSHEDERVVHIIDYGTVKQLEVEVVTPPTQLGTVFSSSVVHEHVKIIQDLLEENQTSIVFANTRNWSERVARDLVTRDSDLEGKIAVHHSSVDRELRFEIEDRMKRGELKAIITSASLELGIDVGSIDLAVQMNSPKSVNRALQRFGRAGHFFMSVSRGKFLVSSLDELLEITAIARLCLDGSLDEIHIPTNAEDVLAQFVVGLTVDKNWSVSELYEVATRSFNYSSYPEERFTRLIESMSNPLSPDENWKYGRIWYDSSTGTVSRKGYQRQNFMMNIGTIPDTSNVEVVLESTRDKIGNLTESFVENLTADSVFILGGRALRYLRTVGNKVIVREAYNSLPTVPSWWGEAMGRSLNVSYEIGRMLERFVQELDRRFEDEDDKIKYLTKYYQQHYPLTEEDTQLLVDFLYNQHRSGGLPNLSRMIVEKYQDPAGRMIVVVLCIFGLGVNIPLAQAYAKAVSERIGTNVGLTATDNGFSLILPFGQDIDHEEVLSLIRTPEQFYNLLSRALEETEIFKTRFRHTAVRGLMVLKNSPKRKLSPDQIQRSAQKLMRELPDDFPLIEETKREIYEDVYDAATASEVIVGLNSGIITVSVNEGEVSPFSHAIILTSVSDIVLNDDRQRLMIDLHQQMISKLRKSEDLLFDPVLVSRYFDTKISATGRSAEQRVVSYILLKNPTLEDLISRGSEEIGLHPNDIVEILKSSEQILRLGDRFWQRDMLLAILAIKGEDIDGVERYGGNAIAAEEYREILERVPPLKLLENAVARYVGVKGPCTLRELLSIFRAEEQVLKEAIFSLQRSDILLAGEFTSDERQYLLNEDRIALSESTQDEEIFSLSQLNHLRLVSQHLTNKVKGDIVETLEHIGPIRHVADIWNRGQFSWTDLRMSMDTREIYFGRFFAGRSVFVPSSLVPLLIRIYRSVVDLDPETTAVLDYIRFSGSVRYSDLIYNMDMPSEEVKERLRLLESQMYISRTGWDLSMSYATRDVFYIPVEFDWREPTDDDYDLFISLLIRWYGPLTVESIGRISKLEYSTVERSLRRLGMESRHVFSKDYLYYGSSSDFERMSDVPRNIEFPHHIFLLSSFDPYLNTSGSVFNVLTMSPDTYRVLYRGKVVGTVLTSPKNDYLEVTNITIPTLLRDDPDFLSKLAAAFFDLANVVYQMKSVVIEEIRSSPPNFPENELFTIVMSRLGFTLDIDHLVGGLTHSSTIGLRDIIEVKLHNIISYAEEGREIDQLIKELGRFTMNKLMSLSSLPKVQLTTILSDKVRGGELHYKNNYFYTDTFWGLLEEDTKSMTEDEKHVLEIVEAGERMEEYIKGELRQTDTHITHLVRSLVRRNLIDPVNPFEHHLVWRRSVRVRLPSMDLYDNLYRSIRIHGPISFEELISQHKEFSNFSRTFILLNLSRLLEERRIESIWLGEKRRQVFYFCPELTSVLKNPTRSSKLPKWMLADSQSLPMKELLGISNLFFTGLTHALFKEGKIVATMALDIDSDELVVSSLRLIPDLSDNDLLGIAQELENYASSNLRQGVVIEKLFDQNIDYWRS